MTPRFLQSNSLGYLSKRLTVHYGLPVGPKSGLHSLEVGQNISALRLQNDLVWIIKVNIYELRQVCEDDAIQLKKKILMNPQQNTEYRIFIASLKYIVM